MRVLILALLFPLLAPAVGLPPGTYNITGFGLPREIIAPQGYDIGITINWDGGSTIASLNGSGISERPIQPALVYDDIFGFWATEFMRPENASLVIQDGNLISFYLSTWGETTGLGMDFVNLSYGWMRLAVAEGSYGYLHPFAGYDAEASASFVTNPEPGAFVLLGLGLVGLAMFRRRK